MQGLIVSNGDISDYDSLVLNFKASDYIVCADGGIRHLRAIKEKPDVVLGDLDSVSQVDLDYIKLNGIEVKKFPSIKDHTDTELAARFLIEKGLDRICFMGSTGDRIDHTLANIFLLDKMLENNIEAMIVDDKNTIYLLDDFLELENQEDSYVSVIPISQSGIEISLSGFAYNLEKHFLAFASTQGVSNEILNERCTIKIHSGKALIIQSID